MIINIIIFHLYYELKLKWFKTRLNALIYYKNINNYWGRIKTTSK